MHVFATMEPCKALSPSAGMIADACHCQAKFCFSGVCFCSPYFIGFKTTTLLTSQESGLAVEERELEVPDNKEELPEDTQDGQAGSKHLRLAYFLHVGKQKWSQNPERDCFLCWALVRLPHLVVETHCSQAKRLLLSFHQKRLPRTPPRTRRRKSWGNAWSGSGRHRACGTNKTQAQNLHLGICSYKYLNRHHFDFDFDRHHFCCQIFTVIFERSTI